MLNDPTLIDPVTGAPFNGSMTGNATLYNESRGLAPHTGEFESPYASRSCISGHVSRRSLVGMGLSEAQARDFFRKPITLRFGTRAYGYLVDAVSQFGVRVYGD